MDRRRPRHPPTQPLVLIAEGHADTRELYALGLSAMGFDVVVAHDWTDGVRRAWEIHPDVIVTDLPIPQDDGWPFLSDLKRHPRTRDIPVVAVTGYVQPSLRERALRDGCAAFFAKPCAPDDLATELRRVLEKTVDHEPVGTSSGAGDTRRCPQCQSPLAFSSRYPILPVGRARGSAFVGRERIRYERAWVCRNGGCDYRELLGDV